MKTISSILFLLLFSSYTQRSTCDTDKLYGKWVLVDSYEERAITVDSLLKMKIVSHKKVQLTYLKSGVLRNDQGDYTTTEMFTLDRGRCMVQSIGLTSNALHNFYILHLDDQYLIGLERGMIYFYERMEE